MKGEQPGLFRAEAVSIEHSWGCLWGWNSTDTRAQSPKTSSTSALFKGIFLCRYLPQQGSKEKLRLHPFSPPSSTVCRNENSPISSINVSLQEQFMELRRSVPQKGSWCPTRCHLKNQTLTWQSCLLFDSFLTSKAKILWSWWEKFGV